MENVAIISTDGASVYVGKHYGMIEILKWSSELSNKVIFLPDLCHKTEILLKNCLDKDYKKNN